MASERDDLSSSATTTLDDGLKRPAPPKKEETREERADKRERQGVPGPFRVKPSVIRAVKKAAIEHNVRVGNLVNWLLLRGLEVLSAGEEPLVRQRSAGAGKLVLPDIPEQYE